MADLARPDPNYTFFGDPKRQFPVIEDDDPDKCIDVADFLAASGFMHRFFEHMGAQFKFVKSDLQENVKKIERAQQANPDCPTLKSLLLREKENKIHKNSKSCTVALLWFRRGLLFMYLLLRQLSVQYRKDGDKFVGNAVALTRKAYDISLKNHHNRFVMKLVQLAISFLPTPNAMVLDIARGDEAKIPQAIIDTEFMLDRLKPILNTTLEYYQELHPDLVTMEALDQCDSWQTESS